MNLFGLIGYPLSHSFSEKFFTEKFQRENIDNASYRLFPIENIGELPFLLKKHPEIKGLNVTIPYKEKVIPFLHEINPEAKKAGAVNTIKVNKGKLKGYNTDIYGFEASLPLQMEEHYKKALILGSGGASKAVLYVLEKFGMEVSIVSRKKGKGDFTYNELNSELINEHKLIVNTTPLGSFPDIQKAAQLPYRAIGSSHYLYDLIYNPSETLFLKKGREKGAKTTNGYKMLELQAEKSWDIWQD